MQVEIYKILGLNKLQYLNLLQGNYHKWCNRLSDQFYTPSRVFMCDQHLYNWYCAKWADYIVKPFLKDNEDFIKAGVCDHSTYLQLFGDYIKSPFAIRDNYPGPLVKKIKEAHYKTLQANG